MILICAVRCWRNLLDCPLSCHAMLCSFRIHCIDQACEHTQATWHMAEHEKQSQDKSSLYPEGFSLGSPIQFSWFRLKGTCASRPSSLSLHGWQPGHGACCSTTLYSVVKNIVICEHSLFLTGKAWTHSLDSMFLIGRWVCVMSLERSGCLLVEKYIYSISL